MDLELLLYSLKEQISISETELNIILDAEEKQLLLDNWDYIRGHLNKYITKSNFIMYAIKKDDEDRNILNIRF